MQRKTKVFLGGIGSNYPPSRGCHVSLLPWQGVSRFATVPWQYSKNHFCFFKQKGKQGKQSKQGQQGQQSQQSQPTLHARARIYIIYNNTPLI